MKPELPFSCPELPGVLPEFPGATPATGGGGGGGGGAGMMDTGGVSASVFVNVADAAGNKGNAGKPSFDTPAGTKRFASGALGAGSVAIPGFDHRPQANTESGSAARPCPAASMKTTEASATRVFTLACEPPAS